MSTTIFPESGDQITEAAWSAQNQALTVVERYRLSGYTVAAGTGLNADIAAGTCVVNGYHIVSDATQAVAVTASQTNYIWLNADGTLSHNTTGTNPGSELLLGKAVTDGSGVTSVSHDFNIKNSLNAYIRKTTDETVNNSSTLQDDADFFFTVAAGDQWEVTLLLLLDHPSATPDFKYTWVVTGGTCTYHSFCLATVGSNQTDYKYGSSTVSINATTVYPDAPTLVRNIITITTGGTLQFQWAQNTANASNTSVAANSILIAKRIIG
tara:strand:+ start:251 stop:1051 length:801 start_codon:yes stop_codon:yes gene_type:complete